MGDGSSVSSNSIYEREDQGAPIWDLLRAHLGHVEDKGLIAYEPARPMRRSWIAPDTEVVYYVRFGDRVKIGTSRNVKNRLVAIPHDEVLAFEDGGRALEQQRHEQFAALRITGEWFQYGDDLKAHIEEIIRAAA